MSEDMSEIMSKDRSERMAKDMSERYVRRYVIRKSVKRFVRKNGKRYVRKMSERMSEDMSERMSEDMSGRTSENMSQEYVHTQIWITRIHVCTNGILWMASCFLFYLAYCSKYCWLSFVFVQWKLVRSLWSHGGGCGGTSWDDLHWDCQSGCQRSWACVARYKLTFCLACWAHVRVHGAA